MVSRDVFSFVSGLTVATLIWHAVAHMRKGKMSSLTLKEDDNSQFERRSADGSLFYEADEKQLTQVHASCRRVPSDSYGAFVRLMPIICVDVVLERPDGKVALVQRGMRPLQGYWWWPGGRILKGETFFTAARRKIMEELGVESTPVRVLDFYNTFFGTSAWDDVEVDGIKLPPGTQTVNAVVHLRTTCVEGLKIDATSEGVTWVDINPTESRLEGHDEYIWASMDRIVKAEAALAASR